jgi:ketosteroid isomerase-like protein
MEGARSQGGDALFQQVAQQLADAFNRRDSEAWGAVFHPEVEFRPSVLAAAPLYHGREGAVQYLDELRSSGHEYEARVRKLQRLADDEFVILTDVVLGGEVVSPGATIVRLKDGKVIEATASLTDETALIALGLMPEDAAEIPANAGD